MKRIIFFAFTALALVTFPSFSMAPAQVVDTHFEQDVAASIFTCDGTQVDITGHEVYDTHAVLNKNRANTSAHAEGHYTGIDANGVTYIGHASYSITQNVPADNGAFSYTVIYQEHFVSQGSTPNFTVRQTVKVTVNANGETTVERFDTSTSCD